MSSPPIPKSFWQYLKSMGPGIIVALTWLGTGDLVDSAIAGGSYGYSLMWAIIIALFVRFVFVSILAKYQLCNPHQETVISGLKKVHFLLPYFIIMTALFFGHFYMSYMIKGIGETSVKLLGFGESWIWSIFWIVMATLFILKGAYKKIEIIFFFFLIILSISLISVAIWTGPNTKAAINGIFFFNIPKDQGPYGSILIISALIGTVGGSIANLLYPYFIQQKGWQGPKYRKIQLYDLAFGTIILILINLSVWTIGAEILHPKGIYIENLDDLANLLILTLGNIGGPIFYLGVFAALCTSIIGLTVGFGYLIFDAFRTIKSKDYIKAEKFNTDNSKLYKFVIIWCLYSPTIYLFPNMPNFIFLTIIASAATVIILPVLCGALWYLTSLKKYIGAKYKNNLYENIILFILFILSIWGSYQAILAIKNII